METTQKIGKILEDPGIELVLCPTQDEDDPIDIPTTKYPTQKFEDALKDADIVITFGGDGTILRAARTAADYETQILGINMGGKGFMAELETDELEIVRKLKTQKPEIEKRMMLDASVIRAGQTVYREYALNDIVIRGYNKVIDLTLYGDGQIISGFTGDGVIIATPTGSTAYSMSAGGPIVEPTTENIIVTPICAHVMHAKPFVLESDRNVTVKIGREKHNPAYISADGCEMVDIRSHDEIVVKKSSKYTRLVRLSGKSFYSIVSEKLRER